MPNISNIEKIKYEIQSIIGKKIAIESGPNYAFEALAYIAKVYFESCGCKVIRFHRVLPSITKILISKIPFYSRFKKNKSADECVMPRLYDVVKWNIQSTFYSYYNFLILCLQIKNIFELTIDGIQIGEQLASEVVRFRQKHFSKNVAGLGLIKSLKIFYLSYKHSKHLINKFNVDTFMVSHLDYSWSMYSKVAISSNKNYLMLGRFPYSILVTPKHNNPYYPMTLHLLQKNKCDNKEKKIAEDYMKERISPDITGVLDMEVSAYSLSGRNFPNKYNNKKEIINCCLFLHSFSDALFTFGYDSFNNIWHWTDFTIEKLARNKNLKIFIKPHPNVAHKMKSDFDTLKKDYEAYGLLKNKYESFQSVEFLSPSTSNIDISSMKNFIGITHHGNVAPELAFLNKPVIASKHAPWKYFDSFSINWENKDEYAEQLDNIGKYIDFIPDKSNLLDFVYRYYIEPNLISDNRFYAHKLYEIIYNQNSKSLSESMNKSEEMLHIIRKDENKLQEGLKMFDVMINQAIINGRNASTM